MNGGRKIISKKSSSNLVLTSFNKKIWIFDRDGVINEKAKKPGRYILYKEDLILNPKVIEFIANLHRNNLTVAVATNQQCVGKSLISREELLEIHHKIDKSVIEAGGKNLFYYVCAHLASDNCECRKPNPGLLNAIKKDFLVNHQECIFIGDSKSDQEAANSSRIDFLYFDEFQKLINGLA